MASVSTLLTSVGLSSGGLANSPWMNGGPPAAAAAPLDHLLHPGLLPEQVQIRAEDDLHRDASERVRFPHLRERPAQGLELG